MFKIPKFRLYGEDDLKVKESIQPRLELRRWGNLDSSEKKIALQQLQNSGWLAESSNEVLETVDYLNHEFLRACPGKRLHQIIPDWSSYGFNQAKRAKAAVEDFRDILLGEKSDALVLRMLTKLGESHIQGHMYRSAEITDDDGKREEYVKEAFRNFDRFADCMNHIFGQFAVNQKFTRAGLVPLQDEKITEEIYVPTLKVLSDPKWRSVSEDLSEMFVDFREERYSEVITKAHRAVQRFLQILVGEEGKNSKGEMSQLFDEAKRQKAIPIDRFTEPIIKAFQSFLPSERATKSTAKPTLTDATSGDALLVMNVVMVFLQHCLTNNKR